MRLSLKGHTNESIPSMKSDELEVGDGKAMPKWLKLDDNWTYTPGKTTCDHALTIDKYHPAYSSNGTGGDLGGALARIMPPKGTSHAVVYGATPTSNRSGAFSVEIDPPPLRGEAQHSYPARNRSISGIPIVLAELDPGKQHTISIRAMGNGEVGIESVRFYKKDRNLLAIILPAVVSTGIVSADPSSCHCSSLPSLSECSYGGVSARPGRPSFTTSMEKPRS